MSDVTNELLLEVLKRMQGDLSTIKDGQKEIRTEMSALRGHMLAIQTDINNMYAKLATTEVRLDRIERRLDIVNEPAH
jgi:predicted  nucleic acid-binding Zn-ribbon protein